MKEAPVGETIHFLGPLTIRRDASMAGGMVTNYGDELVITDEMIEASNDRNGDSWLDLANDEQAQVKRWGTVMFRTGPWLEGVLRHAIGTDGWRRALDATKAEARAIPDSNIRRRRLREIDQEFGNVPTSTTLATYGERS